MSTFLNSLSDQLTAMQQEIRTLPVELDAIMARLDRGKWRSLLFRLNQDSNRLLDQLSAPKVSGVLAFPLILALQSLSTRPVTSEDLSRWRAAHKSEIRVVIGKGRVEVMAAAKVADKWQTIVSRITPVAQQQGYIVLSWDQYQKLLDEIGKLISEDEEPGNISGLPLSTTTPK